MSTNNRNNRLNKQSEKFIKMLSKKEKISLDAAMNKLIELGFENSYNPKEEKKEPVANKDKNISTKIEREERKSNPRNSAAARLISLITLIASALGIFLGVIYVLYIKQ